MTIGVLTTSYPASDDNPAGHFVRGFARWLAGSVGPVEVLAPDERDPAARLARGGLPDRLRGPRGALVAAAVSARLAACARRRAHRWDAIVSHWLLPCGVVGQALARGRRHLAIAHGSDVALLRRLPGGLALARHLARRADLVYVAGSLALPGAPGRVVAMPAAASMPRRSSAERAAARAALGLPPVGVGPPVALFVGRLVQDKGVDLVLAALPEGMPLLVVGDGPARAALVSEAPAHARFLGPRFGTDLRRCYAAADLLVVPSRRDGSPTVVAEARAVGLPILATDVGGLPEAVGHAGRCVAPAVAPLRQALSGWGGMPDPCVEPPRSWAEVGPLLWRSAAVEQSGTAREINLITY